MRYIMQLPPKLPRRIGLTIRPRIHIMNNGRSLSKLFHKFSHGDKFHVNGKHFYWNGIRKRFILWAQSCKITYNGRKLNDK